MGKQEELAKLDRDIKDAEVKFRTFNLNIDTYQKEIDFLLSMESQLDENIKYLKINKIIAMAIEYKKAKEDLKKTRIRLSELKLDLAINQKASKDTSIFIEKSKESHDKLSRQSENNVLHGRFGKKRV